MFQGIGGRMTKKLKAFGMQRKHMRRGVFLRRANGPKVRRTVEIRQVQFIDRIVDSLVEYSVGKRRGVLTSLT